MAQVSLSEIDVEIQEQLEFLHREVENISPEIERYVQLSFDLSDHIYEIMVRKRISRAELARQMGKQKSEIHNWLAGQHNFTLKTLIKLEMVLGEPLIQVATNPAKAQSQAPAPKPKKAKNAA